MLQDPGGDAQLSAARRTGAPNCVACGARLERRGTYHQLYLNQFKARAIRAIETARTLPRRPQRLASLAMGWRQMRFRIDWFKPRKGTR